MPCGGDDDCDEERNFRAGEDLQRGIRSGHYGGPKVCSLEANWVTAGFAAPREGQEEPQEAGSQSNVDLDDPLRDADRQDLHLIEIRLPEALPALHAEQRIPPSPSLLLTNTPLALRDGPIEFLAVDPLLLENSSLRHSRHRHRRALHSSNTNAIMLADCLHNTAGGLHNGHERIRNAGHQLLLNNRLRGHGMNETRDF